MCIIVWSEEMNVRYVFIQSHNHNNKAALSVW
jgi:hypothetical protein